MISHINCKDSMRTTNDDYVNGDSTFKTLVICNMGDAMETFIRNNVTKHLCENSL